jgi:hypothetical protein
MLTSELGTNTLNNTLLLPAHVSDDDAGYQIIEGQQSPPGMSCSGYIAMRLFQIYQAAATGYEDIKVAVAVDNPNYIMPAVRKRWLGFIRSLAKERSSTLRRDRIAAITNEMERMERMSFVVGEPRGNIKDGVWFLDPNVSC